MSHPTNHHFVPQFYLRRFADGNGRLAVRDRTHGPFTNSTRKVMAESDLYTVPGRQLTAEFTLGDFERAASGAIAGVVEGSLPRAGSRERHALTLFIALQLHRAPTSMAHLAFVRDAREALGPDSITHEDMRGYLTGLFGFTPHESEVAGARDTVHFPDMFTTPTPADEKSFEIDLMFDMAMKTALLLDARSWCMEVALTADLITSDRPVVLWHPETSRDLYEGIGIPETKEIWLIVDPDRMLVLRHGGPERTKRIGPARVNSVNAHVARHCTAQIVTHPDNAAALEQLPLARRRPLVRFWSGPMINDVTGETSEVVQSWGPTRDVPDVPESPESPESPDDHWFRYRGP